MRIRHLQRTLLIGAVVLVSTTAAAQSARESFSAAESRKAILDTLPHPKGAKFRRLFLSEHGDSKVTLCGEINAKDRAGVYLGFRRFMVDDLGESMDARPDGHRSGLLATIDLRPGLPAGLLRQVQGREIDRPGRF